ncbi:response regulator [Campylobacter fetus subsp. venerealis]|uniref:response regulator n=1 Tax=Campylobacter fetus TaxID=196 RepID=UPI0018E6EA50|nr:response regulator [Campylobacter fetus]QQF52928.1 response regulator [Campylobacter fetus subsp. venerealis]
MKVLIIENEIYLAQSISSKLADFGYSCEIASCTTDALKDNKFDVVLLSTGLIGQDFYQVIKKHSRSIIILLISYISNDTVSNPIKAGADDYIQKPFMIEELVRKIKLFESYKKYEILNKTYQSLIESFVKTYKTPKYDFKKLRMPFLIVTDKNQYADSFVFNYAKELNLAYEIIDLDSENTTDIIKNLKPNSFIYITEFDKLKADSRDEFLNLISNQNVVISSNVDLNILNLDKVIINTNDKGLQADEILTIDEYVKHMILCYQDTFPDTELSKRLGISRKSLWEKRKKYDLTKKK